MTVNDWAAAKDLQPSALLREHRVQSGLTVPIRLRDRLFGVLDLTRDADVLTVTTDDGGCPPANP